MMPILFDSNEMDFTTNGLGRLTECTKCEVTEERNGVYECEFEYPISGKRFNDIILGRIIGVVVDETDNIQPFDIVSYNRGIDGMVTYHCQHISYRLNKIVVNTSATVTSIDGAFATIRSSALPSIGNFTFDHGEGAYTGYCSCFSGAPKTVKSCLGGVEGSILDTWGGEYEFNKFSVKLWPKRGKDTDFIIRYGVNLTKYTEDADYSNAFDSCVAYWTGKDSSDNDVVIKSGLVLSNLASYNGRTNTIALDLTDKFESEPTVSQLTASAQAYMINNQVNLPAQTISVDFISLKDTLEYSDYKNLWSCHLCDTVKVVLPIYGMEGRYKIVKTVFDVLEERYTSMDLGTSALTLSEALGL